MIMNGKRLLDKDGLSIEGVSVLNTYYQRNCNVFIPSFFSVVSLIMLVVNKFLPVEFKWFIHIGLIVSFIISTFCFLISFVKLFEFTKFWEVQISDSAYALHMLETYQVIEQRGDIFTLIRRDEDMNLPQKVKERFVKPNKKFKLHRKQRNKQ